MTQQTPQRRDNLVIVISFLTFIGLGLFAGLLGLSTPSIRDQFELSLEGFGSLLLIQPLGYIASSFVTGRLNAALGNGRMFILGSTILALGLIGFAIAPSWSVLIIAGLVINAGSGLLDAGLNNYVAMYHNARQMNWLHACFGIGTTLGPLLMREVLARGLAWQIGYVIITVYIVGLLLLFLITLRHWRNDIPGTTATNPSLPAPRQASLWQTLALPVMWLSIALFFVYAGVELGVGQWAYTLFTEGRGIDVETAGLWVAIYWGTFTVGRILFGFVTDRISITLALRLCIAGTILGAALLWMNSTPTVGFGGLALLGFAQAPLFPLLVLRTPDRVGARHSANAIGFQVSAAGIGFAIVPSLTAWLANAAGLESIGLFFLVLAVFIFILHEVTLLARPKSARIEVVAGTD